MPPRPPIVAARDAYAVFEGRPGRPVPVGNQMRYTFEVTRVFRGQIPMRVEVYTPSHSAACGRRFEADAEYLVYARERKGQGGLTDNMCSRTRLSANAAEDYSVLGGSHRPAGETRPQVAELDDAPTSEPPRIEPTTPSANPQGPPSQTPPSTKRGCTTGEMPHGPPALWLGLLALLGIAKGRRRILG
jgi:MYXO-CTERM domain-containing protein